MRLLVSNASFYGVLFFYRFQIKQIKLSKSNFLLSTATTTIQPNSDAAETYICIKSRLLVKIGYSQFC